MIVFNRYILKNLTLATVFITLTLSAVIILTQSLRFLELIIESGASAGTFWTLTILALPRFWEVIIPFAATIATAFTFSRLKDNSELVILRSTGYSPLDIARPALTLGVVLIAFLWTLTLWGTPAALDELQKLKQTVKSQFSVMLLHEGVFNRFGKDFTVYVEKKYSNGTLEGVLIYDKSQRNPHPTTILAQQGQLNDNGDSVQVVVKNGSRQSYDHENRILQRLDFKQYTVDLPTSEKTGQRWKQPDERTLDELLNPDMTNIRDREAQHEFSIELHRRITAPLLTLCYMIIAASVMILGPVQRNPSNWRMGKIILSVIILQGLFIACTNLANKHIEALAGLYILPLVPTLIALFLMSKLGEAKRRDLLYPTKMDSPS